jgi:hypothetical protein
MTTMAAPPSRRPSPIAPDGPSVADEPTAALDRLAARYTFRRPDEVVDYLRRYPHLIPLAIEAAEVFPRYFGEDAPLVLEVFTDPESIPAHPELFAIVRTPLGWQEAMERYDRLWEEWWDAVSPQGPGVMVLDYEYV